MQKKIKGNNVLAIVMVFFSLFFIKKELLINIFISAQITINQATSDESSDKTIISIRGAVSLNVPKTKNKHYISPKNMIKKHMIIHNQKKFIFINNFLFFTFRFISKYLMKIKFYYRKYN